MKALAPRDNGLPPSRIEVKCGPVASIHIKGHRLVLVHDLPPAIDLTTANSSAHPDVGLFAIGPCSSNPIETVAEGYVIARSDAPIANFVADRTLEGAEPCLPIFPIRVCTLILERWRKIEHHDVTCVMRHDSVNVLGADCLRPLLHEPANVRLIARFSVFLCHLSVLCSEERSPIE